MIFHVHGWLEHERIVAPPAKFETQGNISEYLAERLAFGVTTIVLRCAYCGDVKTVEIIGGKQIG